MAGGEGVPFRNFGICWNFFFYCIFFGFEILTFFRNSSRPLGPGEGAGGG